MRQGLCVRRDWNLGLCVRRDWNFVGNAAEHIKVRSSRQKFQHGEVAAVIVPVMGRFNRVVAVDVPNLPESPEYSLR